MGSSTQQRGRADHFRWRPEPASVMRRLQADMATNHPWGEPQKRFQEREQLAQTWARKGHVLWE